MTKIYKDDYKMTISKARDALTELSLMAEVVSCIHDCQLVDDIPAEPWQANEK